MNNFSSINRLLLVTGILLTGVASAQTGKVGINTEEPKETLEIKGTLRVDNLPESGSGKIYNGAEEAGTTFTGVNTVVADAQGNIGVMPFPFGEVLIGGDGADAFTTKTASYAATTGPSTANRRFDETLVTKTFTLDKKSLVVFNTSASFSITNSTVTENTKRVGLIINLNGNSIVNTGVNVVMQSGTQTKTYLTNNPNANAVEYNGGVYGVAGNRYMVLEPGTYTLEVIMNITMARYDMSKVDLRYGNSSADILDVIAYPLQ